MLFVAKATKVVGKPTLILATLQSRDTKLPYRLQVFRTLLAST